VFTFFERYAQRQPAAVRRIGQAAILAAVSAPALAVLATGSNHTGVAVLGSLAGPVFYAAGYFAARARHRHTVRALRAAVADARRDPLTGLPTRAVADRLLDTATRDRINLTVGLADLDGLHAVNSNFGHAAGDQCILAVAARLARAVPAGGCLVRQGGDEFTLLASDTDPDDLAAAISVALSEPAVIAGHRIQPRASVGIAASGGGDAAHTRACADAAMYTAKAAGGNHTLIYRPDRDGRPEPDGTRPLIRRRDLGPTSHHDDLAWVPAPGDDLLLFRWSVEEARTILQALHAARDRWAQAGAEAHAGAQRPDAARSTTPNRMNLEPTRGGYRAIAGIAAAEQAKYARLADRMRLVIDAAQNPDAGQAPCRSNGLAGDVPVGVSAAFTPAEIEGLVRTAAEAVHGDPDDLSTGQRDLAARAHALLRADLDG